MKKDEIKKLFKSDNKYRDIDIYLYLNDNVDIEKIDPLEDVKDFIDVVKHSIESSKTSKVILESDTLNVLIFIVAVDFCSIFNNIKLHFILNDKEVEEEVMYVAVLDKSDEEHIEITKGLDYLYDLIGKMQKEYDPNNTSNIINGENLLDLL